MLEKIFKDFQLTEDQIKKYKKFSEIFLEKNTHINLSAIRDEQGFFEKHILDSLMITHVFPEDFSGKKILDLGTGGGFPGIPLAILYPDVEFVLLDARRKKIDCITEFCEALEIKNITAVHGRAEEVSKEKNFWKTFDFVVSRATSHFTNLVPWSLPFLKKDGILYAYKSEDTTEIDEFFKKCNAKNIFIEKKYFYVIGGDRRGIFSVFKKKKI